MTAGHRMILGLALLASLPALGQTTAAPAEPPPNPGRPVHVVEERALEVRVGADVVARVTSADLAKVTPLPTARKTGGKTHLWPLKDALAAVAGPKARLVAVTLPGGQRLAVDEKAWADPERIPVVWQNRRGLFKLGWVDKLGQRIPDSQELRDVRALEIVRP